MFIKYLYKIVSACLSSPGDAFSSQAYDAVLFPDPSYYKHIVAASTMIAYVADSINMFHKIYQREYRRLSVNFLMTSSSSSQLIYIGSRNPHNDDAILG